LTSAIKYDSKQHSLGYFEGEEEAGILFDRAARAHHGEKAQLNFPVKGESGLRVAIEVPRSHLAQEQQQVGSWDLVRR
jgi:hypothetical protein